MTSLPDCHSALKVGPPTECLQPHVHTSFAGMSTSDSDSEVPLPFLACGLWRLQWSGAISAEHREHELAQSFNKTTDLVISNVE